MNRRVTALLFVYFLTVSSVVYPQSKIGGTVKIGGTTKVGVSTAGGGGGDFVTDTFTAGSDTAITSHTADVCVGCASPNYVSHVSYSGTITVDASLDEIYLTSASASAVYVDVTPSSADYCVQGDFSRKSQQSSNGAISVGMNTGADTMILLRLNDSGVDPLAWEVIDRVTTSSTFLATVTGSHIPTVGGAAVTAKLCRTGTSITAFFNGVQETGLNATTTITATGRAGIRLSGTSTATTGIHIDNFSAR